MVIGERALDSFIKFGYWSTCHFEILGTLTIVIFFKRSFCSSSTTLIHSIVYSWFTRKSSIHQYKFFLTSRQKQMSSDIFNINEILTIIFYSKYAFCVFGLYWVLFDLPKGCIFILRKMEVFYKFFYCFLLYTNIAHFTLWSFVTKVDAKYFMSAFSFLEINH